MIRNRHLIAGVLLLGAAQPAQAFGLRLHLYIADEVLADLAEDDPEVSCDVAFDIQWDEQSAPERIDQTIPLDVCAAIKAHPEEFRAGAIGPDGFPDLIVGQSFVHPGTENGRQTGDWLDHMLSRADSPEEIAFAYGNMMHAAGDIFAHSYVNNYAGGVFEITKFRSKDIERRHTHLEKYIDQRLDYDPRPEELEIPAEFIVDTMVRTSYVPMNQSFTIKQLAELFRSPATELGKILGTKVKSTAPGAHMMVMWAMLAVAEEQQRITPCAEVRLLDQTRQALETYLREEHAAREADRARRGGDPLPDLALPHVYRTECADPMDGSLRGYPDERGSEPAPTDLALTQAQAAYEDLLRAGQMTPDDFEANRRKSWFDELKRSDRRELRQAFIRFDGLLEQVERARALRVFTDYWADDVRLAIMAYMDASLATAQHIVRTSAPEPEPEREGGTVHYERWFDCYQPTFLGDPVAAAKSRCERAAALQSDMGPAEAARLSGIGKFNRSILFSILSFQKFIEEAMTRALFDVGRVLAPSMTELVDTLRNPKRISREDLDGSFAGSGNDQLDFECVSDWIDADLGLLPPWEGEGFRPDVGCAMEPGGLEYIQRPSNFLDPDKFVTLRHAITLGKLALLNQDGIRRLAADVAPEVDDAVYLGDQERYSVIIDTARSLDGSYQWNGKAMPPPREKGYSGPLEEKDYVRAGYPLDKPLLDVSIRFDMEVERRPGFPYYRTDELRREVFARLFPEPFEGEILKAEQFGAADYPFRPCDHDPFRRERGGQGTHRVCATTNIWLPDRMDDACKQVTQVLREVTGEVSLPDRAANVREAPEEIADAAAKVRKAADSEAACRRAEPAGAQGG